MRSEELKGFYAELMAAGFEFDGYATRKTGRTHRGQDTVCDFGILREKNESGFDLERFAEVLAIAEKKRVHFIILPEVRAIRENWQPSEDATPIRIKHEVAACFVHKDAFYDFLFASIRALELLKRNFLYLQEDERILEWGYLLERTNEEMVSFREKAYDAENLFENSARLRNYLLNEGSAMRNVNNIENYMEDRAGERFVDSMFYAINCIRLVSCEGII
jgi:hypothetical protein